MTALEKAALHDGARPLMVRARRRSLPPKCDHHREAFIDITPLHVLFRRATMMQKAYCNDLYAMF
jgi:hypothetical protein